MPATAVAFAAGQIGEAKVAMLVAARTDRLAGEFDRCEATLVDSAKRLTPDQLAKVLQRWRHVARDAADGDPACIEPDEEAESRPSEVFLSQTLAGRYVLSGDLTAADGAILAHGIEVATKSLFHRGGRLSDGAELDPAQRRAVGLVETFKRGVTARPDQSGAQPLILATVDLGLLTRQAERRALRGLDPSLADLGASGAAPGRRGRGSPPHRRNEADPQGDEERELTAARVATLVRQRCAHRGQIPPPVRRPDARPRRTDLDLPGEAPDSFDVGAPAPDRNDPFDLAGLDLVPAPDPTDPFDLGACEIPGTGPIPVEMARRLACNGRVARIVLGADRTVLDMGRAVRLATPEQRRALVARDGGCVFPGCDRGPHWCEAHHIEFFVEDEGPTDLANLALVCSHHHQLVHEGRWILRRTRTGWLATSPTGRRLHRAVPI